MLMLINGHFKRAGEACVCSVARPRLQAQVARMIRRLARCGRASGVRGALPVLEPGCASSMYVLVKSQDPARLGVAQVPEVVTLRRGGDSWPCWHIITMASVVILMA